jgi:hypothetical protein
VLVGVREASAVARSTTVVADAYAKNAAIAVHVTGSKF